MLWQQHKLADTMRNALPMDIQWLSIKRTAEMIKSSNILGTVPGDCSIGYCEMTA